MRGMHDHLLIAVYALAGVAAVEAAALGVLWRLLSRVRAENEALRQQPDLLSFGSKAVKTAPLCVKRCGRRLYGGGWPGPVSDLSEVLVKGCEPGRAGR